MARDEEAVKINAGWAASAAGNREALPVGLAPAGWGIAISISGDIVRQRFNQLLCQLTSLAAEEGSGGCLEWHNSINYHPRAVVREGANFYRAVMASGPGVTGGAVQPSTDNTNASWVQLFSRTASP